MSSDDSLHLYRAIELARRAEGRTSPNPMVGCVLVRDDEVVGEGWHQGPGTSHAEAMAIEQGGASVRGATAFVTLEPCNHYGNTPPCADTLIRAGIKRVVYGVADPNPLAAGGADALKAAGIDASQAVGDAALACRDLIKHWLVSVTLGRPHVTLKWAGTLDGRTATRTGESKWITGEDARQRGHKLRKQTDAIAVGIETILADDPGLDARHHGDIVIASTKIILDTKLRCPITAKCFSTLGSCLVVCGTEADASRENALVEAGATVLRLPAGEDGIDLRALLEELKLRGIISLMVEGGSRLAGSFVAQKLVDEVWAFFAPMMFGGGQSAISGQGVATIEDALRLSELSVDHVGNDLLVRAAVIHDRHAEGL